jgi:hypothetical protein
MSPEQARGEGHRVDGRADIFSLGAVFYELLTARRPFRGQTVEVLLENIIRDEPRPPRQVDDTIPPELERICLKALAKRASDRYPTAGDMAGDLRHFLGQSAPAHAPEPPPAPPAGPATSPLATQPPSAATLLPVKIVPKGLRAFDAADADFFLDLLPGPRDREGLPDSIRFRKTRIEETEPDNTFSVGLIYGPSGCGKSSLVKAGLLPRLANHVTAVYVEAAAQETEPRLLRALRRRVPDLPGGLGLAEALAALRRRGTDSPAWPGPRDGKAARATKVLLVLDQFEQWLHANAAADDAELVHALRQCDGGRVQCLLLVRDDFWMGVTRFFRAVEVRLVEGHNCDAVDLFDTDHAKKVLAGFGRAFGRLPPDAGGTSKDQSVFLDLAVSGLAREG